MEGRRGGGMNYKYRHPRFNAERWHYRCGGGRNTTKDTLYCQTNPLKHLYHSMVNNLFTLTNVQHLACTSQSEPEQSARQPVSVPEIGLLGNRFIRFISGSVCFVTRLNVISGSVFYYNKGFYPSFHNVSDSVPGAEDGGAYRA